MVSLVIERPSQAQYCTDDCVAPIFQPQRTAHQVWLEPLVVPAGEPGGVADVSAVGPMVATLIAGMSTALYTTLVGSVLNIWLSINFSLLAGGSVKLASAVTEYGETHGAT